MVACRSLCFKFGGSGAVAQERQFGQRFLRAARAVVCIEAAGSVRCVWKFSNRVSGNLVRPTKLPRQAIYSAAHEVPLPRVRIRPTPRVPEALGSRQEAVLKYLLRNRGLPILVWKRKK